MKYDIDLKRPVYSARLSNDERYLYYAGKTVSVYDTKEKKTIQRTEKTGNAFVGLSHNEKYLAATRSVSRLRGVEVVLFDVNEMLSEKFRIRIPDDTANFARCFTPDDRYFLLTGETNCKSRLWRIDCESGALEMLYDPARPRQLLTSCETSETGILLSCYSIKQNTEQSRVLLLNLDGSVKKSTPFFPDAGPVDVPFECFWLSASDILLVYELRGQRAFQIVDITQTDIIHRDLSGTVLPVGLNAMSVSPNGQYLTGCGRLTGEFRYIHVYRIPAFQLIYQGPHRYLGEAAFTGDSRHLLFCSDIQCVLTLDKQ